MKRTLVALFICAATGTTANSAEPWSYRKGTVIVSQLVFPACETPESVDEFNAMFELKAYQSLFAYSKCRVVNDGPYQGISLGGFGDYLRVTAIDPAGKAMTFWTGRGNFKSKIDWDADECVLEKAEGKRPASTNCADLADRQSWTD